MGLFTVKKYKIIKDENGNKIQVPKTKEEWNKETKNGTAIHYFSDRYEVYGIERSFKSKVFELKRDASEQERIFKNDPIDYILKYGKKSKSNLVKILKEHNDERVCSKQNNSNETSKKNNDYFKEFLTYKSQFVKPTTIYEYTTKWRKYFKDNFGEEEPSYITEKTTATLHKEIFVAVKENGEPYSLEWKNHMHSILSEFFAYLKKIGKITYNYAKEYGSFPKLKENKNAKKEIEYQTLEEYELFMSIVDDNFWYSTFNFAFWHGCRIGEQTAIRIKDCNLEHKYININSTFSRNETGGQMIGPIKNGKERTIFMADQSYECIKKLIDFYKKMPGYSDEWFLFGGPRRLPKNKINRKLEMYYNKLKQLYPDKKINPLTHHKFGRHSHASFLLNVGADRQDIYFIIAERFGDTVEVIKENYAKPYTDLNIAKTKDLLSSENIKKGLKY